MLKRCILIILLVGAATNCPMKIEHTHKVEYSITENNAVGPTTSMTLRTLSTVAPDPLGTDTVWLATNGNDVNTGTQALPVQTYERAYDLVQANPLRTTIHIFRNGAVGDLEFTNTDDHSDSVDPVTTDLTIQVELGEIATINIDGASAYLATSNLFFRMNGINVVMYRGKGGVCGITQSIIKWCKFAIAELPTQPTLQVVEWLISNGVSSVRNSIFDFKRIGMLSPTGILLDVASDVYDNIFINNANTSNGALILNNGVSAFNIINNTFNNNNYAANISNDSGAIYTFENNIFNNVIDAILDPISYSVQYNLFTKSPISIVLGAGNIVGVAPLFFDELNSDFRLMDTRRTAPNTNQYFQFNSKAVYFPEIGQIPSLLTRDLGPYDVSYNLLSDTWATLNIARTELSEGIDIEYPIANLQMYKDARGNQRRAGDSDTNYKMTMKRRVSLKFKSDSFVGTKRSFEFLRAFVDLGAKRWYPNDDDGLLFSSSVITNIGTNQWEATVVPPVSMVPSYYTGFVCKLYDGVDTYYFRIYDNDALILYLEDARGNQVSFTAGIYELTILYLPFDFDMDSMLQSFPLWNGEGNALFPLNDSPLYGQPTDKFEGHIRSLVLYEAEKDI